MNLGPESIEPRIEEAGDRYVEGEINEEELEREIDRALHLEFTYEELMKFAEFHRPLDATSDEAMVFGRKIARGETLRFDDMYDVKMVEHDVCPY